MKSSTGTPGQVRAGLHPLAGGAPDGPAPPAECPSVADFERLHALYFGFTWRVLAHLGVSQPSLDDAVQEVWLVVYRRLGDFEGRSAVKTWLFGIALNVARAQRRSERRRAAMAFDPPLVNPPEADPELVHAGKEALGRVGRFLATLDEQRRSIFICSLLEHLPAQETADAVGTDVATVYQRVRALRHAFKQWLLADTKEPDAS